MIPTIETERLRLIPPSIECFSVYERFYTDADASRLYCGPLEKGQAWARLKSDIGSWHMLGFGVWVIQWKFSGDLIGTCGYWQSLDWPKELTWWITPEFRRRGIALEASEAALLHAYNVFEWRLVQTYMNDENVAARELVEKLHGVQVDRKEFPDGLRRDIYDIPKPALYEK